ncbi:MAG: Uma2 family endonuclease [Bacteroidota bacterium]
MITDINQLDFSKRYTYADYLTWQFDEMVELIRGKVFRMSPAPSQSHQRVSSNLLQEILPYFKGKPCRVYHAPFDVRLPLPQEKQKGKKVDTVVQPDICVVCDLSKIDESGCLGAPDWVIEILSKGTASKDLNEKFELYQHAGVKEYWIVHPHEATVLPYRLNKDGKYESLRAAPFSSEEKVPLGVFPGFEVDLKEVWGN